MAAKKGRGNDRPAPAKTAATAKAAPKMPAKPPQAGAPKAPPISADARVDVSAEELRQLISEAAYYRAKQRGFEPGHELEDWIQAEAEVIRRLNTERRTA